MFTLPCSVLIFLASVFFVLYIRFFHNVLLTLLSICFLSSICLLLSPYSPLFFFSPFVLCEDSWLFVRLSVWLLLFAVHAASRETGRESETYIQRQRQSQIVVVLRLVLSDGRSRCMSLIRFSQVASRSFHANNECIGCNYFRPYHS